MLLAKNDPNFTKVTLVLRGEGNLKTRLELMRGNVAAVLLGGYLFSLSLHELVIKTCLFGLGFVLYCRICLFEILWFVIQLILHRG